MLSKLRIDVCSSCLRAAGLVSTAEDKAALLDRLRLRIQTSGTAGTDLEIQLGQCQRLCPNGHITLTTATLQENEDQELVKGPENLSMSPEATEDSVVESILKIRERKSSTDTKSSE